MSLDISLCLTQYWPSFMTSYGVTGPLWVNIYAHRPLWTAKLDGEAMNRDRYLGWKITLFKVSVLVWSVIILSLSYSYVRVDMLIDQLHICNYVFIETTGKKWQLSLINQLSFYMYRHIDIIEYRWQFPEKVYTWLKNTSMHYWYLIFFALGIANVYHILLYKISYF